MPTTQQKASALAVSHLLDAAERVADGADVAEECPGFWTEAPDVFAKARAEGMTIFTIVSPSLQSGARMMCQRTPAEARRLAIDLLRAADEAERNS